MKYTVETFPLGIYQANCYLLWKDKHVLIIDPGGKSKQISTYLIENNAIVDGILLTHGHFDHIGGVDYFKSIFNCPIFIDEEDKQMLKDTKINGALPGREGVVNSPVELYKTGTNILGVFTYETIYAPGHSYGSTMLKFDDLLFSGDVLFKGTIGRTDLIVSSNSQMVNTLNEIKTLDPNLIVYPGHGEATTMQEELLNNPFL